MNSVNRQTEYMAALLPQAQSCDDSGREGYTS